MPVETRTYHAQGIMSWVGRILFSGQDLVLHYHPLSLYSRLILMMLHEKKLPFVAQLASTVNENDYLGGYSSFCHLEDTPVLFDEHHSIAIKEPVEIMRHLEKHYSKHVQLQPSDRSQNFIAEEIVRRIQKLQLNTLTMGSIKFNEDDMDPQGPYQSDSARKKILESLEGRLAVIGADYPREATNGRDDEGTWRLLQSRENFEELLTVFEQMLDHCESELRINATERDPCQRWLCAPQLTYADIYLGIILWHLNELGYYKRMVASRPHLVKYFDRICKVDSFRKATTYPSALTTPVSLTTVPVPPRATMGWLDSPWSVLFLIFPVSMIAVLVVCDNVQPLGPKDPYYVPRNRAYAPALTYRHE